MTTGQREVLTSYTFHRNQCERLVSRLPTECVRVSMTDMLGWVGASVHYAQARGYRA